VTVQLQATDEVVERLLRPGVAQVEKEANLRRLLVEDNKGQRITAIDFIVPAQNGAIFKVGKLQYIRIVL
jgi:hypothetical protein